MTSAQAPPTVPTERGPSVPVEPRRQRLGRHTRRAGLYIWAATFIGVFAILVALAAANTRAVKLSWIVGSAHTSLVWIILVSAVLGWLSGITTSIMLRHRTRRPRS